MFHIVFGNTLMLIIINLLLLPKKLYLFQYLNPITLLDILIIVN